MRKVTTYFQRGGVTADTVNINEVINKTKPKKLWGKVIYIGITLLCSIAGILNYLNIHIFGGSHV